MKHVHALVTTAGLTLLLASQAMAQSLTRYQAVPNKSKVRIEGTSTIHDWKMEGTIIGGFLEMPEGYSFDSSAPQVPELKAKPKAEISIPVQSVKSGTKRMDEVMLEHMKQPEFPRITYKLAELAPKPGNHEPGKPLQFISKGNLTIAGVTKPLEMPVTIEKAGDNQIKVVGTAPLKMTDFGIKPPAPNIALGLIKVGDDIKISFDWITQVKAAK